MKLEKALKLFPVLFCIVTTFFFFVLGIQSIFFFPETTFSGRDILGGILMTFTTTLPTFILVQKENSSSLERVIRLTLHFIISGCIAFGFLIYLGYLIVETAVYAIVVFIAMYIIGYIIMEIRDRKLAAKLNERINMLQNEDKEINI